MTKTNLEILTEAQELIRNPINWTKGYFARNALGSMVQPNANSACSWCAVGAILNVINRGRYVGILNHEAVRLLSRASNDIIIPEFNDSPDVTHDEIMAMFNRARGLAREQELASAATA